MAMTKTKTSAQVRTMTRVEVMQDTAERFIQLADRNPNGVTYELNKIEVLFGMKLIDTIRIAIYAEGECISRMIMSFDWDTNRAIMEKDGEDVDPEKIDQYGTLSSITDTMEILRDYLDKLFNSCGATSLIVRSTVRQSRVNELGIDRYYEIMGYKKPGAPPPKPTPAQVEAYRKERAHEEAAMKAKGTKRKIVLPELPEVSIEVS
jgi:hypothetical protein